MAGALRTVRLPTGLGARYDTLAWSEPKPPGATLGYALNCADWLADAGEALASVVLSQVGGLSTVLTGTAQGIVTLDIGGGTPDSIAEVCIELHFASGRVLPVLVALQVGSALPAGLGSGIGTGSGGGSGGGAAPVSSPYTSFVAAAVVSGHRALMVAAGGVAHANPSAAFAFAGISTQAAAQGDAVLVAEDGQTVTEPSWSWAPGDPLFVGPLGVLTRTPPTSGISQQVAVALSATTVLVQPYAPIRLS